MRIQERLEKCHLLYKQAWYISSAYIGRNGKIVVAHMDVKSKERYHKEQSMYRIGTSGKKEYIGCDYSTDESYDGEYALQMLDLTKNDVSYLESNSGIIFKGVCPDISNVVRTISDVQHDMDLLQCEGYVEEEIEDNTPYMKGDDWGI